MARRVAEVRDIMSHELIVVQEDDTVESVMSLFERVKISGAPVRAADGRYVGVISKTDLSGRKVLEWVNNDCHLDSMTAKEVMNRRALLTLVDTAPVTEAVRMMRDHQVHRVFVTNAAGEMIGVVSSLDVLQIIEMGEHEAGTEEGMAAPSSAPAPAKSASNQTTKRTKGLEEPKDVDLEDRISRLILRKQQEIKL